MSETSVDDFLDGIGFDLSPPTAEDGLMSYLTEGDYKGIAIIRWWLKSEMARYNDMLKNNNIVIYISTRDKETLIPSQKPITKLEYAKIAVKYYILMYHLPWTDGTLSKGEFNMDRMAQRLLDVPAIKEMLDAT